MSPLIDLGFKTHWTNVIDFKLCLSEFVILKNKLIYPIVVHEVTILGGRNTFDMKNTILALQKSVGADPVHQD